MTRADEGHGDLRLVRVRDRAGASGPTTGTPADRTRATQARRALVADGMWLREVAGRDGEWLIERGSSAPSAALLEELARLDCELVRARSPHPLVDRHLAACVVGGVAIGAGHAPVLMAGPCAIESAAQIEEIAAALAPRGARFLRGGAWKPRTSPHQFAGHGHKALGWLRRAADAHGLAVVTEALAPEDAAAVAEVADLVQIGSRNMQCFPLLHAVGRTRRPVLLKRGAAATVEEWLLAGEHLLAHGAAAVIWCERGVRGFDSSTRNLFDVGAVALLAHAYGLPVIADPSHACGRRELVLPLARAALAGGAHGLLIEAHPRPAEALCDGPQAVAPEELTGLVSNAAQGAS